MAAIRWRNTQCIQLSPVRKGSMNSTGISLNWTSIRNGVTLQFRGSMNRRIWISGVAVYHWQTKVVNFYCAINIFQLSDYADLRTFTSTCSVASVSNSGYRLIPRFWISESESPELIELANFANQNFNLHLLNDFIHRLCSTTRTWSWVLLDAATF